MKQQEPFGKCPFFTTQKILSGKWTILILHLLEEKNVRFNELQRSLGTITQATLTKQLKQLEQDGLINRKVYAQIPPKVEYSLTDIGKKFQSVLNELEIWGNDYIEYLKENIERLKDLTLQLEFAGSMRRAGARNLEEVLEIINFCKENKLKLKGFWSHFSFADEFDGFYEKEKELVLNVLDKVQKDYDFEVVHLQNSASFLRDGSFEKTTHQRLGIILYGAMPYNIKENPVALKNLVIKNPITVYGEIINIVTLNKGECIGYSNSYIADSEKKVGVVNIGYGDGILRDRLKGKTCIINNKERNIYSTMMSHLVVEIGDEERIGDRVYIYDDKQQLHDYTKYFGPNSVQLAALNYNSLKVKKIY